MELETTTKAMIQVLTDVGHCVALGKRDNGRHLATARGKSGHVWKVVRDDPVTVLSSRPRGTRLAGMWHIPSLGRRTCRGA